MQTLRARVRALVLVMALISALMLVLALFYADEWVEDAAITDLLNAEMDRLVAENIRPNVPFDRDAMMQYLRPAIAGQLPPLLAALPEGVTQDLDWGNRTFWVLVRTVGASDRAVITYRADRIEKRERRLWISAAGAALGLLALAWVYGGRLANFALRPFDRLVRQIGDLDPNRPGQRLPPSSGDQEMDSIRASVNAHLAKVDALVEHERAFSAAASHELRGPLSVIQGSAEVLQGNAVAAQRVSVDRLGRAARQSAEIMEALLALSRREDNHRIEMLSLSKWLPEAAESFLQDAPGVQVAWQMEAVTLMAQAGAARVVFTNLLRNAIQANRQGALRILVDHEGVTIEDSGPGIPDEALAHIFTPGFRLHDGGSGMGLYIAKAVAQRNGWEIRIGNRPQGGVQAQWRFHPAAADLP